MFTSPVLITMMAEEKTRELREQAARSRRPHRAARRMVFRLPLRSRAETRSRFTGPSEPTPESR
jgi:hypothetical protein